MTKYFRVSFERDRVDEFKLIGYLVRERIGSELPKNDCRDVWIEDIPLLEGEQLSSGDSKFAALERAMEKIRNENVSRNGKGQPEFYFEFPE